MAEDARDDLPDGTTADLHPDALRDRATEADTGCGAATPGLYPVPQGEGWPQPNAYSWDGSWVAEDEDFPLPGLLDDEYHDGHPVEGAPSPVLPPGDWDYEEANDDLAMWKGFAAELGELVPLADGCGRAFGWSLVRADPAGVEADAVIASFHGSPGTDLVDLGPAGSLHSTTGQLGDGPDVLVVPETWSLDFRTGSSLSGGLRDNDLVIADCAPAGAGLYRHSQMTIHTGPGADRVFIRDIRAAAVDLGNGAGGRTDALDPLDGDDIVVVRGNVTDTRIFGGRGNDVIFWYLDENLDVWPGKSQGGNLFGGGGAGDAIWGDPGTDRLVLVVPDDTSVVDAPATPNGAVLVMSHDTTLVWDAPMASDPFAKYCCPCGVGPGGRHSLVLDYNSTDGLATTGGYVFLTAIEELQVGIGPAARVFRLDDVAGIAVPAPELEPVLPPAPACAPPPIHPIHRVPSP